MQNKHNTDRRHHIPKMQHRITNWPEYEAGLRSRGSLTLWITPDALAQWSAAPRRTRGGQAQYSDVAIESTLMLGCAFKLRLRQTEGLMSSVLALMGLTWRWCMDNARKSNKINNVQFMLVTTIAKTKHFVLKSVYSHNTTI
jgi:hypothetical protein